MQLKLEHISLENFFLKILFFMLNMSEEQCCDSTQFNSNCIYWQDKRRINIIIHQKYIMLSCHRTPTGTELLKGHLKNKKYLEAVVTYSNLWEQIWICGNVLQSVATDSNLWERIAICGHRFESVGTESVGTDCNLWPHIRICGNRFESVETDCNLWPHIRICGNSVESVGTDCNLWPQINSIKCLGKVHENPTRIIMAVFVPIPPLNPNWYLYGISCLFINSISLLYIIIKRQWW